jgi:drug/metabolite transporter (DMT)-like permease
MMFSIAFGVLASLAWGASDFSGGLASRKTNAVLVVFIGEVAGMFIIPVAAIISRETIMPWQDWLWCLAAGGVGVFAVQMFYKSLASGRMSETAVISGITSAALPVVVGAIMDGLPEMTTIAGFVLALGAVWLISQVEGKAGKIRLTWKDVRYPLLSGIGFGLYFVFIHQGSHNQIFLPMIGSRTAGLLVLGTLLFTQKQSLKPARGAWPLLILNFSMDISGNVFYIVASQMGRMDVAAVLASLYPGITILLAWTFLHEKISTRQALGILLALGAIVLFTI